jgi:hypothetical protein
MPRKKSKFKKYNFSISYKTAKKFEEYCNMCGYTPNKFIKTVIKDFIQNNDYHTLHYFYKKENSDVKLLNNKTQTSKSNVNQLSLFDDF